MSKFGSWVCGINPEVEDLDDGTMVRGLSQRPWSRLGLTADSFRPIRVGHLDEKKKNAQGHWETVSSIPLWRYEGRWQPAIIFRSRRLELDYDGGVDAYHPPTAQHPNGRGPGLGRDALGNASSSSRTAYNPQHPGALINGKTWDHQDNTPWCGIAVNPTTKQPYLQGVSDPKPGFYVAKSALIDPTWKASDPRRYVDATTIPFLVLYKSIGALGIIQGDYAAVVVNGPHPRVAFAIVADAKGFGHGEGSQALLSTLLNRDATSAIDTAQGLDMMFIFFRSSAVYLTGANPGHHWSSSWTRSDVEARGQRCFQEWGGMRLATELFGRI